jgi:pimeloyl-ACP methyl ester carboxylesterase
MAAAAPPQLFMECRGAGAPVVVLEAGASQTSASWEKVTPPLSKLTRVCAYDRAGLGRSPPAVGRHTALGDARALHDLLAAKGEKPPYLLVGHSYGALVVREYGGIFAEQVAGLVLVDSPHEDYAIRASALEHVPPPTYPTNIPIDWPTSFSQVRAILTLGAVPLIVMTAGKIPDGENPAAVALWFQLQSDLARLSSRGRQRTVEHAGHMIPVDAPQAVADAVGELVQVARASRAQ